MFNKQIGRNVEVYVDDIKETFNTLRQYSMKLNPTKYAFRASSRKFLKFMVSQRGIEANPKKVRAILKMSSPKTIKEVQSLMGKVVAFNRFVSKATDKRLSFFKTLKRASMWTDECEAAKALLRQPPLLSLSKEGEDLFLYLPVSTTAVRAALSREENKI